MSCRPIPAWYNTMMEPKSQGAEVGNLFGPQLPVGTSTTLRRSFPEPVTQDRRSDSCRPMSLMRTERSFVDCHIRS